MNAPAPATPRLPEVVVIGAMKCATSAAHRYLDLHPDVAMSSPKELNFFNGSHDPPPADVEGWRAGQWHRGVEWYAAQFDDGAPVRGEASPGYTSPDHPEVAPRMAALLPDVRLVYLVRDPLERAVSQYLHHQREGAEQRGLEDALLDPGSQYVARSRFHERLEPFLDRFGAEQLHVVVQERLGSDRLHEVARLYEHVGVDPDWRDEEQHREVHVGASRPRVPHRLRDAFTERVADDVDKLRALLDDELPEWSS